MAAKAEIFRAEAVAQHEGGDELGGIVRFEPKWSRLMFKVVAACASAFFIFVAVVGVDDFASGPLVVHVEGRRLLTATVAGAVDDVKVKTGAWVEAGAEVVRMSDTDERAEVVRAEKDFDNQVLRMLRDPSDRTAREGLAALRARRDQARNALEGKSVRAPVAGRVSDVRAVAGQHVNPGEVLLAVTAPGEAKVSVVAMVPASFRPMLLPGAKMRFALSGFPFDYGEAVVVDVASEAVGANEVKRILGQERSDAVLVDPTTAHVRVTATVATPTFVSEGQTYAFFDGLTGGAEIRVRREPILLTLVPALRELVPR